MPRFVFRQKSGEPNLPVAELAQQAKKLGAKVLSQTASMLYVEGSEEMFSQLTAAAPDYVSTPEVVRDLPKPPRVGLKKDV
jgi:histone H3/H4